MYEIYRIYLVAYGKSYGRLELIGMSDDTFSSIEGKKNNNLLDGLRTIPASETDGKQSLEKWIGFVQRQLGRGSEVKIVVQYKRDEL